ncbi:MAG: hypothetical protein GC136_07495 [Alphaproteobacteria bacterium]|nr:hypothetical protein [Alphaproteobacteria bacterium]
MSALVPRIYLAGPQVFYPAPEGIFERMKAICAAHGLEGVAPIDSQMGLEGVEPGRPLFRRIVQGDFDLIDTCDGGIFCLDPWRGVEMDTGTAIEIGYMVPQKKPMSGWTSDPRFYPQKIKDHFAGHAMQGAGKNTMGATSGVLRDPEGMLIHSEGLYMHGMAQMPIEMAGGEVFAAKDWDGAFTQAVQHIKMQFDRNQSLQPSPR